MRLIHLRCACGLLQLVRRGGAAALSGQAPEVVTATRLMPVGRQEGLRRWLPVVPGLELDLWHDPVPALVARRRRAKATAGEHVLAGLLHTMTNSLVSGNLSRMDETWQRDKKGWHRWERPGPFCFMPIAVSVQAGATCSWRCSNGWWSTWAGAWLTGTRTRLYVPVAPGGATLADGRHALAHAELEGVLRAFEPLSPEPCWPVWKAQLGYNGAPLQTLVFGQKRHIEFIDTGTGHRVGRLHRDQPRGRVRGAPDHERA